jgi:hypothetical protein
MIGYMETIIKQIINAHKELESDNTSPVNMVVATPRGYCALYEQYVNYIIQPILDNMLPRVDIDIVDTPRQLCGYTKKDHDAILKCFYDYFISNENNEDELISESKLMANIITVGHGTYNPSVIRDFIIAVKNKIENKNI